MRKILAIHIFKWLGMITLNWIMSYNCGNLYNIFCSPLIINFCADYSPKGVVLIDFTYLNLNIYGIIFKLKTVL